MGGALKLEAEGLTPAYTCPLFVVALTMWNGLTEKVREAPITSVIPQTM